MQTRIKIPKFKTATPPAQPTRQARIDELQARIDNLQRMVDELRAKPATTRRKRKAAAETDQAAPRLQLEKMPTRGAYRLVVR